MIPATCPSFTKARATSDLLPAYDAPLPAPHSMPGNSSRPFTIGAATTPYSTSGLTHACVPKLLTGTSSSGNASSASPAPYSQPPLLVDLASVMASDSGFLPQEWNQSALPSITSQPQQSLYMPPSLIPSSTLHAIPAFPSVGSCSSSGKSAIPAITALATYEPQATLVGKRLNWCDMICQALAQQIDAHMVVQDLFLHMCQLFPEIREWAVGKDWEVSCVVITVMLLPAYTDSSCK